MSRLAQQPRGVHLVGSVPFQNSCEYIRRFHKPYEPLQCGTDDPPFSKDG